MERLIVRIALLIALCASIAIPTIAFFVRGFDKPETWTVAAAALAVITSIVSAWSSRRVVELQEDSQRPNPYPAFDCTSRYGLVILRVKNAGGTPAHNVWLEWSPTLKNLKGEIIGFPKLDGVPAIMVLLPGDSITQVIDAHHEFLKSHPDSEFNGFISFEDPAGHDYRRPFRLDGRQYAGTPIYDDEALKTHYELQKIPKELELIRKLLDKLLLATGP